MMNYLKKVISALLFITAFTATLTVGNTFRISSIDKKVEAFEPVIIEQIQVIEEPEEPETEPVTEPATEPEIDPVVEISPPRIDCRLDDATQQMILERCEELDLDFAFVMAVIFRESSFKANADSGSSVGLMQINRINHDWLSKELGITDFFDPEQNVKAGTYMLRLLFEKYEDAGMVLMAYNMGESGARKLWNKGIYVTDYAEGVFQQADKYNQEIAERMGENAA
jgi:hypothetical protein